MKMSGFPINCWRTPKFERACMINKRKLHSLMAFFAVATRLHAQPQLVAFNWLEYADHTFKDFNVWVKAGGPNRADVETIPVGVTNNLFRIDFISNIKNPKTNAIEIISQN